jgi:DNA-binding MarR family transcriptional regulator
MRRVSQRRRRSVLFDLYVAFQLTGQLLELELADSDFPVEDFALYSALAHFERATPTQLAQHLGMPLSTVLFRFTRIESRGHGVRERNPRDGRSSLLGLSARGRRAADDAKPRFAETLLSVHRHLAIDSEAVGTAVAELAGAVGAALAEARDRELIARRQVS